MLSLQQAIQEHLRKRYRDLETACTVALERGCGVRLDNRAGGAYTITVDPAIPALCVYEYAYEGGLVAWDTEDFDWGHAHE